MDSKIRIGTRSSELALWQAKTVAQQLNHLGHETQIVRIDSQGDLDLKKPLYEMGITGVFTKNLDIALLNGTIDIAVHSMKDVPTALPENIVQAAVLKRGGSLDVLVFKNNEEFLHQKEAIIATGSLRRKAQWLHHYPTHTITGLRGNVNTRLEKLEESDWNGAIFAQAGLHRLKLLPEHNHAVLDWMIPAPAQGIVMIAALGDKEELLEVCKELNDENTEICAHIERQFLQVLEGGCSAPIGALAFFKDEQIVFKGALFSLDGKEKIEMDQLCYRVNSKDLGRRCAEDILQRGGKKLMVDDATPPKELKVLSTKQLSSDQTDLFSDKVGFEMSDFIAIRYNRLKPAVIKNTIENVVISSKNGVEALLYNYSPIELSFTNIYCVGRRTKRLIEKKIGKVTHVENSVKELASFIVKMRLEEITYFCSNIRRNELSDSLSENGVKINEVEVYRTVLNERKFDGTFNGVLFYSPSGVESFMNENEPKGAVAFCIGETTASEAKKHFEKVEVAKLPSIEYVIKLVNKYYESN